MAHDGRRPHRRSAADCLQRRVEQLGHLVSELISSAIRQHASARRGGPVLRPTDPHVGDIGGRITSIAAAPDPGNPPHPGTSSRNCTRVLAAAAVPDRICWSGIRSAAVWALRADLPGPDRRDRVRRRVQPDRAGSCSDRASGRSIATSCSTRRRTSRTRLTRLRSPDSELVDLDASAAQVLAAPPCLPCRWSCLTKTESFAGLTSVPGLPADVTNALYEQAQDNFIALAPVRRRSSPPEAITTSSSPNPIWWSLRPTW